MRIARFCNKVARLTYICHADDRRTVVNVMLNYTFIDHALRSARQLSGNYSKKTYFFFFFCNFTHDIFPANWKLSKIIPLPKISNPSDFSDYRPIAILPCLSKAFEVCMHGQISNPGSRLIIVRRPLCSRLSMISVEQ
jgi:hypothetical protein